MPGNAQTAWICRNLPHVGLLSFIIPRLQLSDYGFLNWSVSLFGFQFIDSCEQLFMFQLLLITATCFCCTWNILKFNFMNPKIVYILTFSVLSVVRVHCKPHCTRKSMASFCGQNSKMFHLSSTAMTHIYRKMFRFYANCGMNIAANVISSDVRRYDTEWCPVLHRHGHPCCEDHHQRTDYIWRDCRQQHSRYCQA